MSKEYRSKDEVFEIMGEYYGNAHYRDAARLMWSAEDLERIKQILDEVNALGYRFSTLRRMEDHEDSRLIPIILRHYGNFEMNMGLLSGLAFRSYHACTPQLLALYQAETDEKVRFRISDCLFHLRHRAYIPAYLRIVTEEDYGQSYDLLMAILCKFHVPQALPILIRLLEQHPDEWTFAFLKLGKLYQDPIVIPHLQTLTMHENGEYRTMARKALKRFEKA